MTDNNGWIKIHRKMLQNPVVMKDPDHLAVWMYLLLNATHAEIPAMFGGKKIMLHPGQLITGRKAIAKFFGVNENKIYRVINVLKSEQQITQQTSNKNSLITIVNWDEYQELAQQDEHQMNSNRTASEQQVNTNKNVRMKECNNNKNIYISSDTQNSDSGILEKAPEEPKQTMSTKEARRATYEKAIREAIRNNDRSAIDRVAHIAHIMGCDVDVGKIYQEEKANAKKES